MQIVLPAATALLMVLAACQPPAPPATAIPGFTTQPADQNVVAPGTATFSAVATGTPPPALQWQRKAPGGANFVDIAGATTASHTTAPTGDGDSGSQFRLVASNSAGRAESAIATLTVTVTHPLPWFFAADDGINGQELWKTDGTAAGTAMVKDINAGTASSYSRNFTELNGTVYFFANDGNLPQLWKTDGTPAGTVVVKDFVSTPLSGQLAFLTVFNGSLFFEAWDSTHGAALWRSDGTAAGTALFLAIAPGPFGGEPQLLTVVNGALYFAASDQVHGTELWRSDGTVPGTRMVKDINQQVTVAGTDHSDPRAFTGYAGSVYFGANDGVNSNGINGDELWRTDGTEANTVLVADLSPGIGGGTPVSLTVLGSALYFVGNSTDGRELFRTDGTAAGTVEVKDIAPGANSGVQPPLATFGGALYFYAGDGNVSGLWRSDGTGAGTALVKAFPASAWPVANLTEFSGALYFSASDNVAMNELWRSDGTEAGTVMVKDINPGPGSSDPSTFKVHDGSLLFFASDGAHQNQLWKTDGTSAGTALVKTIHP